MANVIAEDSAFVSNLPQALKRSFHTANEQFLKIAEKMKYHDGSTGIVAIVRDKKVLVANVGDCRALIVSGGRPIQMSIDQKPTNPEEQKRIAAFGGTVVYCMGVARVNRVLAVSRAFGNRTLRQVIRPDAEMMQRELTKDDDYLVMASDGLWDVMKNKDVCDYCYSPYTHGNPQVISDELVQAALMRGSMDNVTCIVVKLKDYVQRMLSGGGSDGNPLSRSEKLSTSALRQGGANHPAEFPSPGQGLPTDILRSRSTTGTELDAASSSPLSKRGAASGGSGSNNDPQPNGIQNRQLSLGSISSGAGAGVAASSSNTLAKVNAGKSPFYRAASTHNPYGGENDAGKDGGSAKSGQLLPSTVRPGSGGNGGSGSSASSSPSAGLFALSSSNSDKWGALEHQESIIQDDGVEDDDMTLMAPQQHSNGSKLHSAGGGSTGGFSTSPASAYASRRPNTVSSSTSGIRSSFTSGMPHLISMFGGQQGSGARAGTPPLNSSSGGGTGDGVGSSIGQAVYQVQPPSQQLSAPVQQLVPSGSRKNGKDRRK